MEKFSTHLVIPYLNTPPTCQAPCWDESDPDPGLLRVRLGEWGVWIGSLFCWGSPEGLRSMLEVGVGVRPEEGFSFVGKPVVSEILAVCFWFYFKEGIWCPPDSD